MPQSFLDTSIALLEEIEASPEKLEWCKQYSVYSLNLGQEALDHSFHAFVEQAYTNGLVITNYHQVIRQYDLDEASIIDADPFWLKGLTYLPTLACIAYHFRRDHFCEGSLISESIASGAMLRMLQHLKSLSLGTHIATTLETLYRFECRGIPNEPGVYWVLAPKGMDIRFGPVSSTQTAPLYSPDLLTQKYADCQDKQILYIGKAGGRKGLRQRLLQYMRYGWDQGTNHKGGRAIWQIQDAGMLLLTYEPCPDCVLQEHQLLHEYRNANGCYPLANWRG